MFGNFSSFMTPSPGWVSIPNSLALFLSFTFCPTSFRREWAAFLGAWCLTPAFRSCFVEFAQHSNDLSMNLWGESGLPILFLCHLMTTPGKWNLNFSESYTEYMFHFAFPWLCICLFCTGSFEIHFFLPTLTYPHCKCADS